MASAVKDRNALSGKPKAGRLGKLPTKRSINLAGYGEKPINLKIAIPAIILILAAAVAFAKFGVIDRIDAVTAAQAEVRAVQNQVDEAYATINSYQDLADQYAHYTISGMTEEETERSDRVAVLKLLEQIVVPKATISAWQITGNQMTVELSDKTLEDVNRIVQELEEDPLVNFCTMTTATSVDEASIKNTQDELPVTAKIVVYLNTYMDAQNAAAEVING